MIGSPLKLPRLIGWQIFTLLLLAFLWWLSPQQLPVVMYKLTLVTLGAVLAYWIDRALFPYARPHVLKTEKLPILFSLATLRRATIVMACVLGLTLGL